jgi:hypothetical protein
MASSGKDEEEEEEEETEQTVGHMELNGGIGPLVPRNERWNGSRF